MNRKQLIEFGIIAIAIIMVFKAIESILSILIAVIYRFSYGPEGNTPLIVANIIFIAIYLLVFLIFIKNRNAIANFIDQKPVEGGADEAKPIINISQQELLYIVFIILAVISLISGVSGIIGYIVQSFGREVSDGIKERVIYYGDFKANFIKIIIASVVIIFAKPLAEFFARRNIKAPEFEFEKEEE
jgi:hypothetical protein